MDDEQPSELSDNLGDLTVENGQEEPSPTVTASLPSAPPIPPKGLVPPRNFFATSVIFDALPRASPARAASPRALQISWASAQGMHAIVKSHRPRFMINFG